MELKKLLYAVDLEDAPHPAIEHVKMVASLTGASVSIDQGREHLHLFAHFRCYIVNARTGEGLPDTRHLGQWASGLCHRGLASLG